MSDAVRLAVCIASAITGLMDAKEKTITYQSSSPVIGKLLRKLDMLTDDQLLMKIVEVGDLLHAQSAG